MAVRSRGNSWQIDVNSSRHSKRTYKSLPKDQYTLEDAVMIEQALRSKLEKKRPAKIPTVRSLVIPYLEWVNLHQSPITYRDKKRRIYANLIPFFGNFLWDMIDAGAIQAYKEKRKREIKDRGAKGGNREINLELLCLTAMSTWAAKNGYIMQAIKAEKLPYRPDLPVILTREEARRFVDAFSPFYRALFLCMFHGGMRRAEAFNLTWDRVDFEGCSVVVTGKGGKSRIIPLTATLKNALQSILREGGLVFPSPKARTTDGTTGNPLTDVRSVIRTAKKRAGIEKRITPHGLRHCFGTYALEGSGDLQAVGELMGHEDLKVTKIYTHLSGEYKRQVVLRGLEDEA
jgi:integrase